MTGRINADIVGTFHCASGQEFMPVMRAELDREADFCANILRTFEPTAGDRVLLVSLIPEVTQFAPFDQALITLGLVVVNADASMFDAGRVEAVIRQFGIQMICGIDASTLAGLRMFGHDPAAVFAGRTVWARPDAFAEVATFPDVIARRMALVGPTGGFECSAGEGIHVDGRNWTIEERGGTVYLSSRHSRFTPIRDLDTGIAGRIVTRTCACGSAAPRILLRD